MTNKKKEVNLKLSLKDNDEDIVSSVQKELLEEELNELVPVKEGDINVAGIYAFDTVEGLEVKIYIRNGFSKKINFEYIPFSLINSKNEVLAKQVFDLRDFGDLEPYSARPYKLLFDKENIFVNKIPTDDWKVVFNTNIKAVKYEKFEYENLPKDMKPEVVQVFNNFLGNLPKIEQGQVSLSKFNVGINSNNNIVVTLIIRNAANKVVEIEKLPITIKDAEGNIIASTSFDTKGLKINPKKAVLHNFEFNTKIENQDEINFKECSVEFNA
jgi:SLAP domain-containing protein